jgi:AraC-like DNA-binding protein/quercetin dioxygenase-like cupin family protein
MTKQEGAALGRCREDVRLSVARDVGGIELMHARFNSLSGVSVPPHIHDEYSISVTLHGGLGFDFRGTKHSAPAGVISCVAPGETHNAYPAVGDRWEFLNLLVPNAVVREVLSSLDWPDDLPDLPRRVVTDAGMVRRLVALYRLLETPGDPLERQSTRTLVLAEFFKNHSTARGSSDGVGREHPAIRRARELLRECFAEPISLTRLAEHAGLSPYHFLRTFRAERGMTPHTYLNQIRVLEAKRRLSAGATTAETAVACGFCDQSHMTRQFKRIALMTPGQYRNAVRAIPVV